MFNFDFLIAALVFIGLTWLHFSKKQTLKDTNRKIFLYYLAVGIVDIVLDIISSYIIGLHNPSLNGIGVFVTTLLYIFQALVPYCMLIYGISLRDISRDEIIKEIATWAVCPVFMIIVVIANVFFGFFFRFDELGNYIHGPAYIAMYVYAVALTMSLGIFIIVYKNELTNDKRKVLWELLMIAVCCVVLQAFNTDILLTGFGIGLGLVVLMLTLNNPLSKTDNLTGKLDQNSMVSMLNDSLNRNKQLHIITINISQLRQINTIFGTKAGDDFILRVMKKLDKFADAPVFRMTGKRFAIVFDDFEQYLKSKERIDNYLLNEVDVIYTMAAFPISSCAISFANAFKSVDFILNYIDFLLEKAESQKEYSLIESTESTLKAFMYNNEVERFIPEAIKNNDFKVFYQPIYDVKKDKIVAVEALSRLYHPNLGYISPDIFIAIAQKNEQICDIDDIQFENACRFLDEHRELLEILENIKINVSPLDILKSDFCEKRVKVLRKYNLPPTFFQFEITETLATIYSEAVLKDIEKLKEEGIRFCMDDFGSGYANLSAVIKIPFSAIKIDRSLLLGILEDERKALLYKGTVDGFKNMGLKIISEGIEHKEEYSLLKSWGVDMIQGYYFSKPLSGDDLLKKLENNPK